MPITYPPPGSDFPLTMSHGHDVNTGATALGANNALLVRFRVLRPRAYTTIVVYVTTQNGNVDAGVFSSDGTTATRLSSTGSTAVGAANDYQILTFASANLRPDTDYYLAISVSGTGAFLGVGTVNTVASILGKMALMIGTSFPLPDTITLASCTGATKIVTMLAS